MQEKRADYLLALETINAKDMIFIDESGANLAMANEYARTEGGSRIKAPRPFNPGTKFSMVAAIGLTGILAMMYVEAAINGDIFKEFIRQMLIPKLRHNQFVILDNVKFHKQKEIKDLIESKGAKVVFLPPYSPDLSPIEKLWSKIKIFLKKLKPRTKADFHNALSFSLFSVNDEDFEEWYEACGYEV